VTSAHRAGVVLALAAALAFGVTTPVVAWAGQGAGPFAVAALLYAGACGAAVIARALRRSDAPLRRGDTPRVVAVAILGGALAPALLAFGLARTGATTGSLLLNLEAVFTVLLAAALYREPIGGRIVVALAAMIGGGACLALAAVGEGGGSMLGVLAVAGATLAWAGDNTLGRPLAERDPFAVIRAKGALGATLTAVIALAVGAAWPVGVRALALLAVGATGYGLSLRLYLLAQRRIGAARTGSVFAVAPFVGAAIGIALGERPDPVWLLLAAALFAVGVVLHASERHAHAHAHPAETHEHPHRHDDGHHSHAHDPPVAGEHSHPHHHDALVHAHDHAPDVHHDHRHDHRH
jgi:drug/metabolite transporter (DMT)-like permease